MKLDSALVAPEYHHDVGASPAPDNLVVSPGTSEYQECNAAASPAPDNLVVTPGPSEYRECNTAASPAPDNLVVTPGPSEYRECNAAASPAPDNLIVTPGPSEYRECDAAASPAPDNLIVAPGPSKYRECDAVADPPLPFGPLVLSTAPHKDQEFDVDARPTPEPLAMSTGQPNAFSPPQNFPTSQLHFNSHISSRSPTPRLDMKKTRDKRRRSGGDTEDKARLVPQDVLMTRMVIQEKDNMIELLKNEVSGYDRL
jgi:hypothetical protein